MATTTIKSQFHVVLCCYVVYVCLSCCIVCVPLCCVDYHAVSPGQCDTMCLMLSLYVLLIVEYAWLKCAA
jgi:hypothetical protein